MEPSLKTFDAGCCSETNFTAVRRKKFKYKTVTGIQIFRYWLSKLVKVMKVME